LRDYALHLAENKVAERVGFELMRALLFL
jgi:hypothetical protein